MIQHYPHARQEALVRVRLPIHPAHRVVPKRTYASCGVVGAVGAGPAMGEGYVGAFEEAFVGIGVSVRSADWVVVQGADAAVGGLAFAGVKQGDSSALEEA